MRESCPTEELLALLAAGALDPGAGVAEGETGGESVREIEAHVISCPACSRSLETSRSVSRALRDLPLPAPSEAAKQRAHAAVLKAMEAPGAEGSRPSAPPLKLLEKAAPAAPSRRRFQLVAALTSGLAAAACLMVVIGSFERTNARMAPSSGQDRTAWNQPRPADAEVSAKVEGRGPLVTGSGPTSVQAATPGERHLEGATPAEALAKKPATPAADAPSREKDSLESEHFEGKDATSPTAAKAQAAAAGDSRDAAGLDRAAAAGDSRDAAGLDREVTRLAAVNQARAVLVASAVEGEEGRDPSTRPFRRDASLETDKKAPRANEDVAGAGTAGRPEGSPEKDRSSPTAQTPGSKEKQEPTSPPDARKAEGSPGAGAPLPRPATTKPNDAGPGGAPATPRGTVNGGGSGAGSAPLAPAPPAAPTPAARPLALRGRGASSVTLPSAEWVVGDVVLVLESERFFVRKSAPVLAAGVPLVPVDPADPSVRALALHALDQEVAITARDLAWAQRVVALARLSGIDPRPAPGAAAAPEARPGGQR